MNFAEQLNAKKNSKVIEFADGFLEKIKPRLIESAQKGYSAYRYTINTNFDDEKQKLQLYSDSLFVDYLNKNLDGVKVIYKKEFKENLILRGYGSFEYHLLFNW